MKAGLRAVAFAALVTASTGVNAEHRHPDSRYVAHSATIYTASGYGTPVHVAQRRPYDWCRARAARLREFEQRARRDGRVSQDELRIAAALRADLAATCHPRWRRGGVREMR